MEVHSEDYSRQEWSKAKEGLIGMMGVIMKDSSIMIR